MFCVKFTNSFFAADKRLRVRHDYMEAPCREQVANLLPGSTNWASLGHCVEAIVAGYEEDIADHNGS